MAYLERLVHIERDLDGVTDHENNDNAEEQSGHGRVAAVRVSLGDGVVVRIGLKQKRLIIILK